LAKAEEAKKKVSIAKSKVAKADKEYAKVTSTKEFRQANDAAKKKAYTVNTDPNAWKGQQCYDSKGFKIEPNEFYRTQNWGQNWCDGTHDVTNLDPTFQTMDGYTKCYDQKGTLLGVEFCNLNAHNQDNPFRPDVIGKDGEVSFNSSTSQCTSSKTKFGSYMPSATGQCLLTPYCNDPSAKDSINPACLK